MTFQEIDDDLWDIVQNYLPPIKPHIGRPRCDPCSLFNGILYVLNTGCSWHNVPAKYGTKSVVHRYHLELSEKGMYQAVFLDPLRSGYGIRKIDLSHCSTDTKDIPAKRGDRLAMMAIKSKEEQADCSGRSERSFPRLHDCTGKYP